MIIVQCLTINRTMIQNNRGNIIRGQATVSKVFNSRGLSPVAFRTTGVITMFLHVTNAKYVEDYKVEVTFNDGREGVADLASALKGRVFEPLITKGARLGYFLVIDGITH